MSFNTARMEVLMYLFTPAILPNVFGIQMSKREHLSHFGLYLAAGVMPERTRE